jgi:hypothetical protein
MNWIDERIKQLDDRDERERLISLDQVRIYEELSTQLHRDIEYVNKTRRFSVKMNGNSALHDRIIECNGKKVNIKLDKKTHVISSVGENINLSFALDICPNGGVCLKNGEGAEVYIPKVAEIILDPILFPDLPPENNWAKLGK